MQTIPTQSSIWKVRIPTLLGLGFLVVALVLGTYFFSQGTGVFSPRATPETTPKNLRITNVTDSSFTVSFMTDAPTTSFVRYGTISTKLDSQKGDDRDQLSGSTGEYTLHHISVRGLQAGIPYYFVVGTANGALFDNQGSSFEIRTAKRDANPAPAKTIHGTVSTEAGLPADGAVVYVQVEGAGEMSSLVKSSGSWAIPLSSARTTSGDAYAVIEDNDLLLLNVQGIQPSQKLQFTTKVSQAQPVPALVFGQEVESLVDVSFDDESIEYLDEITAIPTATRSGALAEALEEQEEVAQTILSDEVSENTVVNLEVDEHQVVTTTQPLIVGRGAPLVEILIEVNSETKIVQTVNAGEDGAFSLDLSSLAQNLEPGEHSVRYSYTDPSTGEFISRLLSFTVYASEENAYGTQNPYPVATASPSPTPSIAQVTPTPTLASAQASLSATPAPTIQPTLQPTINQNATESGRVSMPSTSSAIPVSGSIDTTILFIIGGMFFIIAGGWSYWIALQVARDTRDE